jgi:hypothetical protein
MQHTTRKAATTIYVNNQKEFDYQFKSLSQNYPPVDNNTTA